MRAVLVAMWPALLLVACGGQEGAQKLRIYTSIYPHVLERMEPDKKAIHAHIKETGEIPVGVEYIQDDPQFVITTD